MFSLYHFSCVTQFAICSFTFIEMVYYRHNIKVKEQDYFFLIYIEYFERCQIVSFKFAFLPEMHLKGNVLRWSNWNQSSSHPIISGNWKTNQTYLTTLWWWRLFQKGDVRIFCYWNYLPLRFHFKSKFLIPHA